MDIKGNREMEGRGKRDIGEGGADNVHYTLYCRNKHPGNLGMDHRHTEVHYLQEQANNRSTRANSRLLDRTRTLPKIGKHHTNYVTLEVNLNCQT